MSPRRVLLAAAALAALGAGPAHAAPPPVKHVFIVVLENEDFATTSARTPRPPTSRKPAQAGALLTQYYGTGHFSLDNYITMISGQAPNPETQADCQSFTDFRPGTIGADGQALGTGCVYPAAVQDDRQPAEAKGLTGRATWRTWAPPSREASTCAPPAPSGSDDTTQKATRQATSTPRGTTPSCTSTRSSIRPTCASERGRPRPRSRRTCARPRRRPNYSFITPEPLQRRPRRAVRGRRSRAACRAPTSSCRHGSR